MSSRILVSTAVLVAGVALASAQNAPGGTVRTRDQVRNHTRDIGISPVSQSPTRGPLAGKAVARTTGIGRVRGQPPSPMPGEHRPQDYLRSEVTHRLPDQGMGRADGRAPPIQPRKAHVRAAAPPPHARQDRGSPEEQAQVSAAQAALNRQGFNVGPPDGKLGRRTKEALIAFQQQHGLHATGKVDRTTAQTLSTAAPGSRAEGNRDSGMASKPTPAAPQSAPTEPPPAARGDATPAPAAGSHEREDETSDGTASGRVPAGSPQQDYSDETPPADGDQR